MVKLILLIASLLLTACGLDESRFKSDVPVSKAAFEDRMVVSEEIEETEAIEQSETGEATSLPESINLDVPFFSQAPDADWNLPWQEACEEASIALVYYYSLSEPLTKEQFKKDVLGLVDWQKENFGDYIHSTVDQTAEMLEGYFGFMDYRILENPTIEDMKKELAAGRPIVAPFAGRMLGNPFYSDEGPYYHMLVIKGYDDRNFITNDVGTKRGENFIYSYETTMNALHDYHPSAIETAPGRVIVID